MSAGGQGDRGGQERVGAGGDQVFGGPGEPAQPGRQAQVGARGRGGPGQDRQNGGGLFRTQFLGDGQHQPGRVVVGRGLLESEQEVSVGEPVRHRWTPQRTRRVGVDQPELGRQPPQLPRVQAGQRWGPAQGGRAGGQVAGRDQERSGNGHRPLGRFQDQTRASQGCGDEPLLMVQDPTQRVTSIPEWLPTIAGRPGGGVVQDRKQGCGVQVQRRRNRRRNRALGQDGLRSSRDRGVMEEPGGPGPGRERGHRTRPDLDISPGRQLTAEGAEAQRGRVDPSVFGMLTGKVLPPVPVMAGQQQHPHPFRQHLAGGRGHDLGQQIRQRLGLVLRIIHHQQHPRQTATNRVDAKAPACGWCLCGQVRQRGHRGDDLSPPTHPSHGVSRRSISGQGPPPRRWQTHEPGQPPLLGDLVTDQTPQDRLTLPTRTGHQPHHRNPGRRRPPRKLLNVAARLHLHHTRPRSQPAHHRPAHGCGRARVAVQQPPGPLDRGRGGDLLADHPERDGDLVVVARDVQPARLVTADLDRPIPGPGPGPGPGEGHRPNRRVADIYSPPA